MEFITYYLIAFVVLFAALAIRTPDAGLRVSFFICLFWPVSVVFMLLILAAGAIGWEFDILFDRSMFGFRTPDDGHPGFAVSLLTVEFLFWKKRSS